MRSLSAILRRALYAQQTGEVLLPLLTIEHDSLDAPLRFVADGQDLVSGGDTYQRFPFEITLPPEDAEAPPAVHLAIDNIDRQIVEAVRSIDTSATVSLSFVLAGTPDVVEAGPFAFTLRDVEFNDLAVTGSLTFEPVLDQAFPADKFTPGTFPGVL